MEFGTLIPLFYMGICCFITIPIAGFFSLAFIRFSLKDKLLAKCILITILIVALVAFIYPILNFIRSLILITFCCPDSKSLPSSKTLLEMASITLKYALFLIFPSLTIGFLIAFVVTVPVTFLVRYIKKRTRQ